MGYGMGYGMGMAAGAQMHSQPAPARVRRALSPHMPRSQPECAALSSARSHRAHTRTPGMGWIWVERGRGRVGRDGMEKGWDGMWDGLWDGCGVGWLVALAIFVAALACPYSLTIVLDLHRVKKESKESRASRYCMSTRISSLSRTTNERTASSCPPSCSIQTMSGVSRDVSQYVFLLYLKSVSFKPFPFLPAFAVLLSDTCTKRGKRQWRQIRAGSHAYMIYEWAWLTWAMERARHRFV